MPQKPRRLSSNTREAAWQNQFLDYAGGLELRPGSGYRIVPHPAGGYSLALEPSFSRPGAPVTISRFVLEEVWANTLRCHTWDGTTEGAENVYIAKPDKLRKITTLRIDGINILYSYDEVVSSAIRFQFRVAIAAPRIPENQIVIPRYLVKAVTGLARGDEIWALKLETPIFTETDPDDPEITHEITWLDLNVSGRAWGKQFPV